ncbi:MAG: RHS repeat protein [Saprospiraceae bacterium]|nr:RHS repeat protein [Saprospiraceae bacterium]
MKHITVFWLCLHISLSALYAGIEPPVFNKISGTAFMSGSATVSTLAPTPSNLNFTLKSVTNIVKLYSDQNSATLISFDYRLEVPVKITYYAYQSTTPVVKNEKLVINFHNDPSLRREYQQTDGIKFSGGYNVDVQVQQPIVCTTLTGGTLTAQQITSVLNTVFLHNEIQVERYFNFNPSAQLTPGNFNLSFIPASNELEINWQPIDGAEEYDLEWVFVDNYDSIGYTNVLPKTALRYNFAQNAARVQVKSSPFKLPLVYERGHLLFRIRGIGRSPLDKFIAPVAGLWSCSGGIACSGLVSNFPSPFQYEITQALVYENDKMNWRAVANYAEEGKRKTAVSHLDGTLNNRQTVTVLSTDRMAIVGEQILDFQGRAAIQVLPTPVNNPTIKFYRNFNQNQTPIIPYSREHFDKDQTGCTAYAAPMRSDNTSTPNQGASNYYSPSNMVKTSIQAYLPDALGYPFTQTEFMPDNTGRIRRQAGVGEKHRLGSGHETRYFYGTPGQEELDRLFGNEVGDAEHYKKNMVEDANKQLSISYLDPKGNVVATALAGQSPAALQPLPSYQSPQTAQLFTEDLLAANVKDTNDFSLTTVRTLTVSCPGDYDFVYRMTGEKYQDLTCMNALVCYDCIYDLELTVVDNLNCNQVLFHHVETIGKLMEQILVAGQPSGEEALSTDCANPAFQFNTSTDLPAGKTFKINFQDVGTYTVIKKLKVNQAAADVYVQDFLNDPSNLCSNKLDDFLKEEWAKIDSSGCNLDCDDIDGSELNNPNLTPAEIQEITAAIADMKESLCDSTLSLCETAYLAMLADVSPGGQYGYLPGTPPVHPEDIYVSVYAPNSVLPNNGGPGEIFRQSGLNFKDKNGLTFKIDLGNGPVKINDATVSLNDFLDNWRDEWAEELVQFHPERCYYEFCIDYLQQPINLNGKFYNSEEYDTDLAVTDQYADAVAKHFIDPATNGNQLLIANNDPFFNGALASFGINVANNIQPKIGLYTTAFNGSGAVLSMKELAITLANCPNSPTSACKSAAWNATGNGDREWLYYRTLYTSAKQEILFKTRSPYAIAATCYNGCIGESPFNYLRFSFGTIPFFTSPFWSSNQYCGVATFHAFANKIKRFPSIYDLLPPGFPFDFYNPPPPPKDILDAIYQDYSQQAGEMCCNLNSNFPKFIHNILKMGVGTHYIPDATYDWPADVLYIMLAGESNIRVDVLQTGNQYTFQFYDSKLQGKCYVTLTLSVPTGGKLDKLSDFYFTQANANSGPFTMTASFSNGISVSILGKVERCNIQCPEKPGYECPVTKDALDWAAAFNYMAVTQKLTGTQALPGAVVGPYLTGALGGPLTQNSSWAWFGQQSGTSYNVKISNGSDLRCDINFSLPAGLNINNVTQCLGITPNLNLLDANRHTRGFRMKLKDANNVTHDVEGTASCFSSSFCCNPYVLKTIKPFLGINTEKDIMENCRRCQTLNISGGIFEGDLGECPINCDSIKEYWIDLPDSCGKHQRDIANYNALQRYEKYIDSLKAAVKYAYMHKCLAAVEGFWVTYRDNQHHFTLYFYDQANNLVKTVPPAGVVPLSAADIAVVAAHRNAPKTNPAKFTAHKLVSNYRYNSLNQLIWQKIPDHKSESLFFYDALGRLVASINARQKPATGSRYRLFTYTKYDPLGRIVEVGESTRQVASGGQPFAVFVNMVKAKARDYNNWAAYVDLGQRTEITRTEYDRTTTAYKAMFPNNEQVNLRGRVVAVTWQPNPSAPAAVSSQLLYSYDIHGNVKTLVQKSFLLDAKTVQYDYDILSGKVNGLDYQRYKPDQFLHRYTYNADNRLTEVRTSPDGVFWDKDAAYQYYKHGPLARTELGNDRVQGLDYAYTLHGWIKAVNSSKLSADHDLGHDGQTLAQGVARDAMGYQLGYYDGDYKPIGAGPNAMAIPSTSSSLYNGNIRQMVTAIEPFMRNAYPDKPLASDYLYDQLNRICTATYNQPTFDKTSGVWSAGAADLRWKNTFSYDANGNILRQQRNGNLVAANATAFDMDDLQYTYYPNSNQLQRVTEQNPAPSVYTEDIEDQTTVNNYLYDPIGNLSIDAAENLNIQWNLQGKVSMITDSDTPYKTINFGYNPMGNRVLKNVDGKSTYHALDANGNVLATYRRDAAGNVIMESAWLYGSSRLGEYRAEKCVGGPCMPTITNRDDHVYHITGKRRYEESNHLGNVLAVVSDRKIPTGASTTVTGFGADVIGAQDYYAFGMGMPGRIEGGNGRFGFNGQESDDEILGKSNSYSAEYWQYDSRLGRRWNIDPVAKEWESPYTCFSNNPIWLNDVKGDNPNLPAATHTTTDIVEYTYIGSKRDAKGEITNDYFKFKQTTTSTSTSYHYDEKTKKVSKMVITTVTEKEVYLERKGQDSWNQTNVSTKTSQKIQNSESIMEMPDIIKYNGPTPESTNYYNTNSNFVEKGSTTINSLDLSVADKSLDLLTPLVSEYKNQMKSESMGSTLWTVKLDFQKTFDQVFLISGIGSAPVKGNKLSKYLGGKYMTLFSAAYSAQSFLRENGVYSAPGKTEKIDVLPKKN